MCVETSNAGKLLYIVEFGTEILMRKLERFIKKCMNIKI